MCFASETSVKEAKQHRPGGGDFSATMLLRLIRPVQKKGGRSLAQKLSSKLFTAALLMNEDGGRGRAGWLRQGMLPTSPGHCCLGGPAAALGPLPGPSLCVCLSPTPPTPEKCGWSSPHPPPPQKWKLSHRAVKQLAQSWPGAESAAVPDLSGSQGGC